MRVAFLNWRDLTHPCGGGAERYAQTVCAGLAQRGHDVTFFCAAHEGAPAHERLDGYRILRQGGTYGVYAATLRALRRQERRDGRFDVVVDTQNGIAFFATLATRTPVVNLLHHVHREVWPIACPPLTAKTGWFLESKVAPAAYRAHQYVTVSGRTREEMIELGIDPFAITVIHNGTDPARHLDAPRAADPTIVVLGRLVPHKRVELAVDVVVALRDRFPTLRLRVIGDGWWREPVEEYARDQGVADRVDILGFVDEDTKHRELSRAWLALAPSAKEGWGLNVVEAAAHGVPSIAHHGAGGLSESIIDGVTGVLVHDQDEFVLTTARLLEDALRREQLGYMASLHAERFTWRSTVETWETLLEGVAQGAPLVGYDEPRIPQQAQSAADTVSNAPLARPDAFAQLLDAPDEEFPTLQR